MTTYSTLAWVAQTFGLLAFMAAFFAICFYALRPRNASVFDRAARLPMSEDERA
jgi:cytochrome c oxidase cbb3-type subunit IV